MLRSGRDYDHVASESDRLSPRFLGSFIFRASYWRQTSDLKRFAPYGGTIVFSIALYLTDLVVMLVLAIYGIFLVYS